MFKLSISLQSLQDPEAFSIYLYRVKGKIIYPTIYVFYSQASQIGV